MAWLDKVHHPEVFVKSFCKWGLLGLLMGVLGGLLTVAIYRAFRMTGNRGTNEIIDSVLEGKPVSPMVAPVIFLATATTHLFGGSAGREGAALQLGGSVASMLSKIFKLNEDDRRVMIMSGMSSVFAGLFGTPLTATFFCMEFESVGTIFSPALLPCCPATWPLSPPAKFPACWVCMPRVS